MDLTCRSMSMKKDGVTCIPSSSHVLIWPMCCHPKARRLTVKVTVYVTKLGHQMQFNRLTFGDWIVQVCAQWLSKDWQDHDWNHRFEIFDIAAWWTNDDGAQYESNKRVINQWIEWRLDFNRHTNWMKTPVWLSACPPFPSLFRSSQKHFHFVQKANVDLHRYMHDMVRIYKLYRPLICADPRMNGYVVTLEWEISK